MSSPQDSVVEDREISIFVNGKPVTVRAGQSVAAALLATGRRTLRRTAHERALRGIFCGMGACYDCLVTIDEQPNRRACMTQVSDGLRVVIAEP